jgi:hypothetical protein
MRRLEEGDRPAQLRSTSEHAADCCIDAAPQSRHTGPVERQRDAGDPERAVGVPTGA